MSAVRIQTQASSLNSSESAFGFSVGIPFLTEDGFDPTATAVDNSTAPTCDASAPVTKHMSHCVAFEFAFYTVVMGIVCLMGLIGNVLFFVCLQNDKSEQRVPAFLLQSVAVADSSVLVVGFFGLVIYDGLLPYAFPNEHWWYDAMPYVIKYVQPVGYMTETFSVWVTMLLAINRYISVCKPFHMTTWCTMTKVMRQMVTVVIFSMILNIPRFFQWKVVAVDCGISIQQTSIGEYKLFGIVYSNALYTILVLILPLVLLVLLNGKVIRMLYNHRKWKRHSIGGYRKSSERNVTMIMITLVLVFIVCRTPDRILQILKNFYPQRHCGTVSYYLTHVCNFLIILSSSVNFFIYYTFTRRFRRLLGSHVCSCFGTKVHSFRESMGSTFRSRDVPRSRHLAESENRAILECMITTV